MYMAFVCIVVRIICMAYNYIKRRPLLTKIYSSFYHSDYDFENDGFDPKAKRDVLLYRRVAYRLRRIRELYDKARMDPRGVCRRLRTQYLKSPTTCLCPQLPASFW